MAINLNSNGVFVSGILIADTVTSPNGSTDSLQNLTSINGSTIDAALEIKSTTGGLQPPRMTTAQKNVLFPDVGMLVVDTTLGQLNSYIGGAWVDIGPAGGDAPANATYILQTPNAQLPNAQALNVLGNGVMLNTAGVVSTQSVLSPTSGGSGINNGIKTITLGGNLITSGAFASTFTMTNTTNVTFPTSGTLLTAANAVTSITGTANQITASASIGNVTLSFPSVLHSTNNVLDDGTGKITSTLTSGTVNISLAKTSYLSSFRTSIDFSTGQPHVFEIGTDSGNNFTSDFYIYSYISSKYLLKVADTGSVLTVNNTLDDGGGDAIINGEFAVFGPALISTNTQPTVEIERISYASSLRASIDFCVGSGNEWEIATDSGDNLTKDFFIFNADTSTYAAKFTQSGNMTIPGNLSANNFLNGYATTVTAAGTTTLTVSSAGQQYFVGVATQTVILPVVSTLALGTTFLIVNNSFGNVTVQSSGGNTIQILAGASNNESSLGYFTSISTVGTGISSWEFTYTPSSLGQGSTAVYVNSGTSFQMVNNARYVPDVAPVMVFTLPANSFFGDVISVIGKGTGGWKIAQNSGQQIYVGSSHTTVGVGGSIASTQAMDSVRLVCISANTIFSVEGAPQGNLTIV